MKNLRHLIRKHTVVTRRHLTPEIALRLITPQCELWHCKPEDICFPKEPFWAFYWPGGQALSRYMLDEGARFRDARVLEVGSGCGAGAVAAARGGAARVLANDVDPCAISAMEMNAQLNGVTFETSGDDMIGSNCEDFDTILIGDMFYDEEFAKFLFSWLEELAKNGKTVLIGDPGRHGLTDRRRGCLKLLAQYSLAEDNVMENSGFREASVWKLDMKNYKQ